MPIAVARYLIQHLLICAIATKMIRFYPNFIKLNKDLLIWLGLIRIGRYSCFTNTRLLLFTSFNTKASAKPFSSIFFLWAIAS